MRRFIATLAASLAAAAPAFAASGATPIPDDEVIATAQAKPTPEALKAAAQAAPITPAASRPLTTQEQIAAFLAETPAPRSEDGPRGLLPADRDEDGKPKVHGSMGVSVGTGGYRSAYASALFPVGENTTVGVAVSKTDFGKHGGFYADPYAGGPYYGGPYGYGYGRLRGGSQQSVALSVMTGGPGRTDDTPDGCAPGFRTGGRYVEPLWVAGMRDGAHPCDATSR
ncbi:hypothetical protein [Caulobacter sp. X]|uniref:hypothetical protein n=1 Tax=Caulobacter sp. X TaxID=2048901 RepID=UPI000C15ECE7|nr:hypothetical protein [Caulobacter sp. X]PIB95695.1 hypothetical protein CSW60_13985 [Caulobacter sp. X]